MSLRKIFALITMIILVLLIINMFLPMLEAGRESISFWDYLDQSGAEVGNFFVLGELVFGVVICILMICNVLKDYKYALSSIPIPLLIYILLFVSYLITGGEYISIGCILGPILSIASLVLIFVGNGIGNKSNTNDTFGAQIKGYDPMTGKPIYATFKGYNTQTGEPIFD